MTWLKHLRSNKVTENVTVTFVPTSAGAYGSKNLSSFLATCTKLDNLIGSAMDLKSGSASTESVLKSRIEAESFVVEELLVKLNHDEEIMWLLPGVRPTNKDLCFPMVITAKFEDGLLGQLRFYWDQATVLKQIGLVPTDAEFAMKGHVNSSVHALIMPVLSGHDAQDRFLNENSTENVNILQRLIGSVGYQEKESNKKDSIGAMLSGEVEPEKYRPSTKLDTQKIAGKSQVFEDVTLPKPSVQVDPKRFQSHFSIGMTDDESKPKESSLKATVVVDRADIGKHRPRLNLHNQSQISLTGEDIQADVKGATLYKKHEPSHDISRESEPEQAKHTGKKHFANRQSADEDNDVKNVFSSKKHFPSRNASTWASTLTSNEKEEQENLTSSNSLLSGSGKTEPVKPSSRVLSVPGGVSSISLG